MGRRHAMAAVIGVALVALLAASLGCSGEDEATRSPAPVERNVDRDTPPVRDGFSAAELVATGAAAEWARLGGGERIAVAERYLRVVGEDPALASGLVRMADRAAPEVGEDLRDFLARSMDGARAIGPAPTTRAERSPRPRRPPSVAPPPPPPPPPAPAPPPRRSAPSASCDPNYSGCVPPYPPDVDCADVAGPVTVRGADPHRLDGDGDGIGCE